MIRSSALPTPSLLITTLLLAACNGPGPSDPPPPPGNPGQGVTSISIAPDGQSMAVGDTLRFHAEGSGGAKGLTAFAWGLSTPGLAVLDADGLLHAVAPGTLAVRACAQVQPSLCGAATVTIR